MQSSASDEHADALARQAVHALGTEGPFARAHPGYVVRQGQLGLAGSIARAIDTGAGLIAEAGTGTGKTFAYLVPALLSGGRVLISTGTRTLQDQLFARDVPEVVRALDLRVQTALLKGRSNYVCWHHLQRNLQDGRFARREDIAHLRRIERFAAVTDSGDRAELAGLPEEAPAWSMATSTRENCLGQDCPDLARCFVVKARQAAQRADVVVVNHHLLCADLALRDEGVADLLPTSDVIVFDEAHQLPDVATQFFGSSVSTRKLAEFARDLLRAGLAEARDAADWTSMSQGIEQSLRELRLAAGRPGRMDGDKLRVRTDLLAAVGSTLECVRAAGSILEAAAARGREVQRCALRAAELCEQIARWLQHLGVPVPGAVRCATSSEPALASSAPALAHVAADDRAVVAVAPDVMPWSAPAPDTFGHDVDPSITRFVEAIQAEDRRADERAADQRAASAQAAPTAVESGDGVHAEAVAHTLDRPALPATVVWMEISAAGLTMHATPLSVADVFRRHRQQHRRAWVFVSATLAFGGDLAPFASSMGIDDAEHHVWDSPYDYATQGLLYVPQGIGAPSGEDFPERVFRHCWPVVMANEGRAFLLCTTLRMVDRLAALAREALRAEDLDYELLVQGDASRAELLERFRAGHAPVLIGSASFWEGVDVPGRQLSLVVIDKLPFAPPDEPVLRARIEAARRAGEDPFRTLQLPAAAMALKQGAGRLIRSEQDRGLLMVCDERLAERPYGRRLLRSLPPFRRTRSAEEALAFVQYAGDAVPDIPANDAGG